MKDRTTNEKITGLTGNQIFVFGSNLAGIHGAGAAYAATKWGAAYGKGEGHAGWTYAIPTKDRDISTLPPHEIRQYVTRFAKYAEAHPEMTFLVIEIGCGLAGLTPEQVAPMFAEAAKLDNVHLPARFWTVLGL